MNVIAAWTAMTFVIDAGGCYKPLPTTTWAELRDAHAESIGRVTGLEALAKGLGCADIVTTRVGPRIRLDTGEHPGMPFLRRVQDKIEFGADQVVSEGSSHTAHAQRRPAIRNKGCQVTFTAGIRPAR